MWGPRWVCSSSLSVMFIEWTLQRLWPLVSDERMVAALRRVLLVARQVLVRLDEPGMVDVELGAPRQRRVRDLVFRVPAERVVRFVRLDVRGLAVAGRAFAPAREADVPALPQRVQRRAGRKVPRRGAVRDPLARLSSHRRRRSSRRGVLLAKSSSRRTVPSASRDVSDFPRSRPFLHLLGQQKGDIGSARESRPARRSCRPS